MSRRALADSPRLGRLVSSRGAGIVALHKRITARKHMGDDAASWAVFVDGRPMVTGLTKPEVPYYKKQALDYLLKN